ncbi:MAG: hypothetical protein RJB25_379, partial [Bacteroidota bacterium]
QKRNVGERGQRHTHADLERAVQKGPARENVEVSHVAIAPGKVWTGRVNGCWKFFLKGLRPILWNSTAIKLAAKILPPST